MSAMEHTNYREELTELISDLNDESLKQILVYVRALKSRPPSISGEEAIRIAREINWDKSDLAEIAAAIEASRQIDPDPEVHFD